MAPATTSIGQPLVHRTSTGKKNFDALTGLRFFAAIAVVFYHFAGPLVAHAPAVVASGVNSGFLSVSLFYVLSGFVLSYSYVSRPGEMRGNWRSFWVARLARIYPAYLLAFLLAAPYNILWSMRVNHLGAALAKLGSGALLVLTMQQAWTPWTAWYWNFPAWSVSVEAFFYLSFPFVALLLGKVKAKACWFGMGALWLTGLLAPCVLFLTHGVGAGTGDRLQMAVEFTPLLRLPEFLIGVLLGRAYVLGFRFSPAMNRLVGYGSGLAILTGLALGSHIPRPVLAGSLFAPLFALLIYSLAESEGALARFLSLPVLVLLGEASYGIYILQVPVSYVMGIPPPHTSVLTFSLYLLVLIATSLLSWRFVEAPLRLRIRNWLLGSKAAPKLAPKRQPSSLMTAPAVETR